MFICNRGRRSLFGKKDCETNAVTIYQKFESSNPSEQQIGTNVFLRKQEINRLFFSNCTCTLSVLKLWSSYLCKPMNQFGFWNTDDVCCFLLWNLGDREFYCLYHIHEWIAYWGRKLEVKGFWCMCDIRNHVACERYTTSEKRSLNYFAWLFTFYLVRSS